MRTADDWSELAALLRRLMPVAHLPTTRPLGRHYDVVITEAGPVGDELLRLMDVLPGGCGPVIADMRPTGAALGRAAGHRRLVAQPVRDMPVSTTKHPVPASVQREAGRAVLAASLSYRPSCRA